MPPVPDKFTPLCQAHRLAQESALSALKALSDQLGGLLLAAPADMPDYALFHLPKIHELIRDCENEARATLNKKFQ